MNCEHQWVDIVEFGRAGAVATICDVCGMSDAEVAGAPAAMPQVDRATAVQELLEMARDLAPDATPPPGS